MIRPLAISMGDSAGVGPEITAKAWKARELHSLAPFFAVGCPGAVEKVWDGPIARITNPDQAAAVFDSALPVLAVGDTCEVTPGEPDEDSAKAALQSLELAVGLANAGAAGGVVTGPVSKVQLYKIGFTHPGPDRVRRRALRHLVRKCRDDARGAHAAGGADHGARAAGPRIRAAHHRTGARQGTGDRPRAAAQLRHRAAALAFAGLNPHAGESGEIGREEIDVLQPAIAILREEGIDAIGPFAADAMFHPRARAGYDVALCPTHDQALIPIKTLHFDEGVNITLGLPIVRTSPDHGTAFGIAGTDQANPGAMIAAIKMAASAAQRRADAAA
jgi:4-hydroxythreonine-4-phosphate dehydrogenase